MVDNSFATLRSELGLLLDKTRHLIARQEDPNPRENEYDAGFEEGYSAAMKCMEGNIHELLTATWAYCDTQEKPVPDFNTKNEIANLAHKVGEIGDRVASLEVSRTNHNQGCETFWASLAETLQAYRSFLASNPISYTERERLTISRTVAEVLDILTRANKGAGV